MCHIVGLVVRRSSREGMGREGMGLFSRRSLCDPLSGRLLHQRKALASVWASKCFGDGEYQHQQRDSAGHQLSSQP